ncbi:MAG: c-type cytochrome [Bryobacteraceae bacterium]
MRHKLIRLFAMALFLVATDRAHPAQAQTKDAQAKPAARNRAGTGDTAAVARGRYIVDDLVRCTRCHTPLTPSGERDRTRWLMGAPIQVRPTYKGPEWALVAPRLAGRPPGTDEEFIRLMTTAIARTGEPPRMPMLRLHMTREDAEAVLAYLKSLPH